MVVLADRVIPKEPRLESKGSKSLRWYTTSAATTRSGHAHAGPRELAGVCPQISSQHCAEPPLSAIVATFKPMFCSRRLCGHAGDTSKASTLPDCMLTASVDGLMSSKLLPTVRPQQPPCNTATAAKDVQGFDRGNLAGRGL